MIDSVTLALTLPPAPLTKDVMGNVVATANTFLAEVLTNATKVEFMLLHSSFSYQAGALKPVKEVVVDSSASPTGVYSATFTASMINEPGMYQVQARALVEVDGVVVFAANALSDEFQVVDVNQADSLNNFPSDLEMEALDNKSFPLWKTVTLTGAQMKTLVADASQQVSSGKLFDLENGAVLVGGMVTVNSATATAGAVVNLGSGASADNVVASAALDVADTTDVSAAFVPVLAESNDMNMKLDMGVGKTIADDLEDEASVTFTFGFTVPQAFSL